MFMFVGPPREPSTCKTENSFVLTVLCGSYSSSVLISKFTALVKLLLLVIAFPHDIVTGYLVTR